MTGPATEPWVEAPHFVNERSIEIGAPRDAVWPWLAQMGFGRAGWYSWDIVDNLGRRSARELHPEWMIDRPGDPMPGGPLAFDTPVVEPPSRLVIAVLDRSVGPWTVDFALSYDLAARGPRHCLLSTRAVGRIDGPVGQPFARWFLGPGDAVMVAKQLRGIKERAEAGQQ